MKKRRIRIAVAALCGVLGLLTVARGAPLYWVGPADGLWSDAANWSLASGGAGGDGPPTATDTAVFDGGETNSAALDAAFAGTVGAVQVTAGYTGSVTQRRDLDVSGDFDLLGGVWTFVAGTPAALDVDGDLTVAAELRCPYSSLAGEGTGRVFTVGQSLTVAANGWINADSLGFPGGQGPAAGSGTAGANHGGMGGDNTGTTYGSMVHPISLGSGGITGQTGGGAILITAGDALTVSGTISASALQSNNTRGGAGGSIRLSCASLAGTGTIRALGGGGGNNRGGGGGRISLHGVANDTFTGTLSVNGGGGYQLGRAGTIFLSDARRAHLTLGGAGNLASLRLGTDGVNDYTFGTITIENNGVLGVDGHQLLNGGQGGAAILHCDALDIKVGGVLSADGGGFSRAQGPGAGSASSAGSHGGMGGDNLKTTYGSLTRPASLGSGGSDRIGGGALLVSAGSAHVDGTIRANGSGASNRQASGGGTVRLSCATLTGSGTIEAKGGAGYNYCGGGGGRLGLLGMTNFAFTGTISASGQSGTIRSGAAGTIYVEYSDDVPGGGRLVVDNNGVVSDSSSTLISASVTDTAVGHVVITNAAWLKLGTNQTFTATGDWRNHATFTGDTNSLVTLAGAADATVLGDNIFWSFCVTNTGKTVTFASGATNTVRGHLHLAGVTLRATEEGVQTWLDLDADTGTQTLGGVRVRDNNASVGQTIVAASRLAPNLNEGNNVNWDFGYAPGTLILVR